MYSVERETPIRGGQLRGTKGGGGNTWPKQQQTSPSALMPDGPRAQTDQRAGNLPDLGLKREVRTRIQRRHFSKKISPYIKQCSGISIPLGAVVDSESIPDPLDARG